VVALVPEVLVSDLVVDAGVVSATGSVIRSLARMMDPPSWAGAFGSGSGSVDEAVHALNPVVGRQVLGAASEVCRIGQGAVDCVAHLLDADAALARQG
jgi:hypothetical protein